MRPKTEKTDKGKFKAVVPKKKKANYGEVVTPTYESKEPPKDEEEGTKGYHTATGGESDGEGEGQEGEGKKEKTEEEMKAEEEKRIKEELMSELLQAMVKDLKKAQEKEEKESKERSEQMKKEKAEAQEQERKGEDYGEREKVEKDKAEGEKKEEEKKEEAKNEQESREKKKKDELLTEYLVMHLRLKALAEILGSTKVAEIGKGYYSFIAVEGVGVEVCASIQANKKFILDFNGFPCFDSPDKAQAFLELCHPVINRYCHLMSVINPIAVASRGDIEVIYTP